MAAPVLGAHDPRRPRFRASRRLHPFQSREARPCFARARLAVFVVSPLCPRRSVAVGLGGRCSGWPVEFWRAESLIPDFAALNPGYAYLRWLEMAITLDDEQPQDYPATLLGDCQKMIQKRFRQSIDEPRHFEKVQWFAKYWNSIVPPAGKNGLGRI